MAHKKIFVFWRSWLLFQYTTSAFSSRERE